MTTQMSDLNIESLRRALAGRVIGAKIHHHELLGSTMDETKKLAARGAPEGTVVIAEEQTAGRGRFNRVWISPRGQNLSFSLLLKPHIDMLPQVNMAATLAVADTIEGVGLVPTIKWPNDVRIGGLKTSGILIENDIVGEGVSHCILGIGLNVNFDPSKHEEIAQISTSLFRETGKAFNRTDVLTHLLISLDGLYAELRRGVSLTSRWSDYLDTLGKTVQLKWREEVVEGVAEAVDEQGNLLIRMAGGSLFTAIAGEVTLQV
ncbi:MAG: biotin--[acetyl-CoA-carboxylase] ligase [Chloroflexi bacterium]|nr:biotin--[acetyl-CoA-carboxylase] ligase [Chloroflexota bacterium]